MYLILDHTDHIRQTTSFSTSLSTQYCLCLNFKGTVRFRQGITLLYHHLLTVTVLLLQHTPSPSSKPYLYWQNAELLTLDQLRPSFWQITCAWSCTCTWPENSVRLCPGMLPKLVCAGVCMVMCCVHHVQQNTRQSWSHYDIIVLKAWFTIYAWASIAYMVL